MRLHRLLFIFITSAFFWINAQESAVYTSHLKDYQKAIGLYNSKQYKAAQSLFEQIGDQTNDQLVKSECDYYIANCAVRLNQRNADELIEDFVTDYPTSTKRNLAYMDVADYYFLNSQYAYAQKWYSRVDEWSLDLTEKNKYYFRYGYCLYHSKDERQASKYLRRVADSKEYGSQAKYYLGFLAYEGDDYDAASSYFEQVNDDDRYKEKLAYYQADLNFKLGKFEEAISLAEPQLTTRDKRQRSELNKIIGESYFNLKRYSEAIPYLNAYEGKNGQWSNTDYYQLGYAYYQQSDYEQAVKEFNKIIDGRNEVAQNAYYHLAESYINLDQKTEALNAFRNASQMDFDSKIQEDAWLNYAKLSYDIGNPYESVPAVLTNFLKTYPDSGFRAEIEDLLIDSYISSKNYEEALDLLKGKSGFENKKAFQKVAFYRGLELYSESELNEAKEMFEKALTEPRDPFVHARSLFWLAETNYNLLDYNEALIGFKQFRGALAASRTVEYQALNYHLAYTYFKLKDYDNATKYFRSYVDQKDGDLQRTHDALLRLGDGYFVSSKYENAIKAYEMAISAKETESGYAAFQSAMSYGFLGQVNKKTDGLEDFVTRYTSSALRDDAIYELGNTYVKAGDRSKALLKYEELQNQYPKSVFIPKAQLRQGLVYYNSNQNQKALKQFKALVSNFPRTEEAVQAVATARLVYIDLGAVDEYAEWVRGLDFVEVTDAELDNASYLAAEKQYLDGNTDAAITQFNNYLNRFADGLHSLKAHFYLAQLYYQKNLPDNAKDHYKYVADQTTNEFTETASVRLAEIYLNKKEWNAALPVLIDLEQTADYPQNRQFAKSNLLKIYYQQQNYSQAKNYASELISSSESPEIQQDAKIILARSAFELGDEDTANAAYIELSQTASGSIAAEALYKKAYFENKNASYLSSNETLQKLIKNYGSYQEFSSQGLVVMAKNYSALEDAFQATYILESVIENFQEYPTVVDEAKRVLKTIKTEQSKTNSSIETGEN